MVDRRYALRHADPPGRLKRAFDQQLVPALIDLAGLMEAGVERVAARVRHAPASALGCAVGLGLGLALLRPTAKPRRAEKRSAFRLVPAAPKLADDASLIRPTTAVTLTARR